VEGTAAAAAAAVEGEVIVSSRRGSRVKAAYGNTVKLCVRAKKVKLADCKSNEAAFTSSSRVFTRTSLSAAHLTGQSRYGRRGTKVSGRKQQQQQQQLRVSRRVGH
jgi:hypothetical protein